MYLVLVRGWNNNESEQSSKVRRKGMSKKSFIFVILLQSLRAVELQFQFITCHRLTETWLQNVLY